MYQLRLLRKNAHQFTAVITNAKPAYLIAHERSTHQWFRNTYCTPHGSKVAMRVKMDCQLCKLGDPQLMSQEMGRLPEEQLTPSPPSTHVGLSLDLFGPFTVKEEVQKRTFGKAY